ncbi:CheR family methyltransferase [Spiribacter halobius]|uniref:protein-glutamate O-methyltransferase n=1 Tax=Sediminicurvatus halobius TaxID=2182432 RepID=A0A2U2MZA2_9GAMM|nr:protein-glutamate O-methyltransferase CheR [Spiribacter halobius]PWG62315.1 chemotaxis protein [Spiribacter halobius]UEX79764.1 protein-glutamate O-methyltransferase CheR [Spiribacter halobius]
MAVNAIDPDHYDRFRRFLERSCGIVLGSNKQYLVASRLGQLMARQGVRDLGELVQRLEGAGSHALRSAVIDAMTTNETQWFRDTYPFEMLESQLLPALDRGRVRIWSAACSSGQEAYSLSMAVQEYRDRGRPVEASVVGTDISPQMIERARAGAYSASEIRRGLSAERQRRFFVAVDKDTWRVRPEVSRGVSFRQHNLLESFTLLGSFEIIFCRNVLIYFSLQARQDILHRMAQALVPGGYLVLGASESLPRQLNEFELVRTPQGVAYRRR